MKQLRAARSYYNSEGLSTLAKRALRYSIRVPADYGLGYILNRCRSDYIISSSELQSISNNIYKFKSKNNYNSNAIYELSPSVSGMSIGFYPRPHFQFNEQFVAEINNCVLTKQGDIIIGDRYVEDSIKFDQKEVNEKVIRRLRENLFDSMGLKPSLQTTLAVDSAVVLCAPADYYYLWIVDEILKLRLFERYEEKTGEQLDIIVPSDAPTYVWEILKLLGYNQQVIQWNRKQCHINTAIIPSFPEPTPSSLKWLKNRVLENVNNKPSGQKNKKLYISRQNSQGRAIKNYDDILPVLNRHNFKSVFCEKLSVEEQILMFNEADVVVAPHGAGLTNIIWGSKLQVIEIFNDVIQPPYYVISHMLGHKYNALSGEGTGNQKKKRHRDIILNPDNLESVLNDINQDH